MEAQKGQDGAKALLGTRLQRPTQPGLTPSQLLLRFGAQSRDCHVTRQQLTPTFFFSFLTSSSASSARETNWNRKPGDGKRHTPPHYSKHLEDGVLAGGAWLMRTVGVMLRPPWCFSSLCSAPSLKNPPRRSWSPAAPGCAERLPVETPLCSSPLQVSWSVLRRQRSRFRVRTRSRLSSKGVNDPQRSLFTTGSTAEGSLKLIVPALGREIPVLTGMCLMLEQIRECRIKKKKNLQQCLKDSEKMLYFFCRNVLHVQMFSLEQQTNLGVEIKPNGAESPFTPVTWTKVLRSS